MSSWSNLYLGWATGMTDYIAQHIANYSRIEYCLDYLYGLTGGGNINVNVPLGLQQIFDRNGIIGKASYQPPSGNHGTSITIPAGAAYLNATFYVKATSTAISMVGQSSGTFYVNLDAAGNPTIGTYANNCIWQFSWNGSNTVSNVALYSGVSILLDGDDYNDMLTSAYWGTTYQSVADRFEDIEKFLNKAVQTPTSADTINVNVALGSHIRILLDRATTTINFSGGYDGQKILLELLQDNSGGRLVSFGTMCADGVDFVFPIPFSGANLRDFVGFVYSAGNSKYNYVSLARGY